MSWVPIFLWLNAASFAGYGLMCLVRPALPAGYAGFELTTTSGAVEVMAMYGGLQLGFGVLLAIGARDPAMRATALMVLAILGGSLFLGRLLGLVLHGTSPYNLGAASYEVSATVLSIVALRARASRGTGS